MYCEAPSTPWFRDFFGGQSTVLSMPLVARPDKPTTGVFNLFSELWLWVIKLGLQTKNPFTNPVCSVTQNLWFPGQNFLTDRLWTNPRSTSLGQRQRSRGCEAMAFTTSGWNAFGRRKTQREKLSLRRSDHLANQKCGTVTSLNPQNYHQKSQRPQQTMYHVKSTNPWKTHSYTSRSLIQNKDSIQYFQTTAITQHSQVHQAQILFEKAHSLCFLSTRWRPQIHLQNLPGSKSKTSAAALKGPLGSLPYICDYVSSKQQSHGL